MKFEAIGKHAIKWYIEHGRKDIKNFRIRMNIILRDFGDRIADEIKPSEIDGWLKGLDRPLATKNRCKTVPRNTQAAIGDRPTLSGKPIFDKMRTS